MPTTPTYGLRYQALSDAPDGAGLGEHLALDVEGQLARVDADIVDLNAGVLTAGSIAGLFTTWTDYTPTWTATINPPSVGNGLLKGAYLELGQLVFVRVYLKVGSTSDTGDGSHRWALPFPATSPAGLGNAVWCGAAIVRDDSAGDAGHLSGVAVVNAGASEAAVCAVGRLVGAHSPYASIVADDYVSFTVAYERA